MKILRPVIVGLFAAGLAIGSAAAQTPQQCVTNAVAGGTADAITVPLLPCGLSTNILILTISANNTTTTPTLQMAGFPALPILTNTLQQPGIGDFGSAGSVLMLTSTGSSWLIINGNVGGFIPLPLQVSDGGTGDTTLTTHGVLYGNGTSAVGVTAAGLTGQILSGNTGSAPSWSTIASSFVTSLSFGSTGLTPNSSTTGAITVAGTLVPGSGGTGLTSYTAGDLLYASGTTTLTKLGAGLSTQVLHSGTTPSWGAVSLTADVTGTLPVSFGGTGATSFAAHGIPTGQGTSPFGVIAPGTTGQILVGVSGGDPVFTSVPASGVSTWSGGTTGMTPSSPTGGVVTMAGVMNVVNGGTGQSAYTDGQLLIGNTATGGLTKATITPGTGISVTNSNGSITIAATAVSGNTPVSKTTSFVATAGTSQNPTIFAVDTTSGAVTATLPASPSNGDTILFLDKAQHWNVANFILARNSLTIMNIAQDMTVSTNNANFHVTYVSDTGTPTWLIW